MVSCTSPTAEGDTDDTSKAKVCTVTGNKCVNSFWWQRLVIIALKNGTEMYSIKEEI